MHSNGVNNNSPLTDETMCAASSWPGLPSFILWYCLSSKNATTSKLANAQVCHALYHEES